MLIVYYVENMIRFTGLFEKIINFIGKSIRKRMKGKGSYFKSYKQQVAYLHNQRPKEQFNVEESKNSKFNRQQLQLSDDSNIPRSPTNNSSTQSPINRVLK